MTTRKLNNLARRARRAFNEAARLRSWFENATPTPPDAARAPQRVAAATGQKMWARYVRRSA